MKARSPDQERTADLEKALQAVEHDRDLLEQLARLALTECPSLLEKIREGVREGDPKAVQLHSHTLKSTLRLFHAKKAEGLSRELEEKGTAGALEGADDILLGLRDEVRRFCKEITTYLAKAASGP